MRNGERAGAVVLDADGQAGERGVEGEEQERGREVEEQPHEEGGDQLDLERRVREQQRRPGEVEEEQVQRRAVGAVGGDEQEGEGGEREERVHGRDGDVSGTVLGTGGAYIRDRTTQ